MKFSPIFLAGVVAFAKADLLDDIENGIDGVLSDIDGGIDGVIDEIQTAADEGGEWASSVYAEVTQAAGEVLASLSEVAATATGDAAAEASSAYAEATEHWNPIVSEAGEVLDDVTGNDEGGDGGDGEEDAAPMNSVTWALAGLMGGAAIFVANL